MVWKMISISPFHSMFFGRTRSVIFAEISSGVLRAAPYFDPYNNGASRHPKIEFVRSDAYRALMRRSDQFDLIVSEPSNPWAAGIEMLFSREFLTAARDRLAPGGVYVQWYHLYENNDRAVELVLRTYASELNGVRRASRSRSGYRPRAAPGRNRPGPRRSVRR